MVMMMTMVVIIVIIMTMVMKMTVLVVDAVIIAMLTTFKNERTIGIVMSLESQSPLWARDSMLLRAAQRVMMMMHDV